MAMELRRVRERPTISDPASSDSATTTAVNTPDSDQFPQDARSSHSQNTASEPFPGSSGDDSDAESAIPPEDSMEGWPQLAQLMAQTPDFAAFPRFRDLQVKSLLYYQCELSTLRKKLHELEFTDKAKRNKPYNENVDRMIRDRQTSDQFKTIEEIRIVLKKYNKALLQYSQICALPDPEPFNMRTLRKWLKDKDCANWHVKDYSGAVDTTWGLLVGNPYDKEKGLWSQFGALVRGLLWMRRPARSQYDPDLALTKPREQVDGLTHWYASEYVPFKRALKRKFAKERTQDVEQSAEERTRETITSVAPWKKEVKADKTLESWSEDSALRLTSGISTVVACLMPVIAISVLSQLQGLKNLLICLAAFSLVFAVGLIALTQGTSKRTEVFAATAAFSAVMVVFISIPPAPVIMMPPGSALPSVSPSAVISALPSG